MTASVREASAACVAQVEAAVEMCRKGVEKAVNNERARGEERLKVRSKTGIAAIPQFSGIPEWTALELVCRGLLTLPPIFPQNELESAASSSRRVAASGQALLGALQAQLAQLASSAEAEPSTPANATPVPAEAT